MDKRLNLALIGLAVLAVGVIIGLSIPPAPVPQPIPLPTQNLDAVRTEAVGTFAADMTATASVMPSPTVAETETPAETPVDVTASTGTEGPSPTPACLGLRYVRDVTIPDNTPMTPAQVFTKSWLVENSGTCPWEPGFQVVLIGGLAMGGSPFQLTQQVGPGGRIQISIKMVAPTDQTGIVQGTWKMADATGTTFGDFMSVVIVVGKGTPATPAPIPSITATP